MAYQAERRVARIRTEYDDIEYRRADYRRAGRSREEPRRDRRWIILLILLLLLIILGMLGYILLSGRNGGGGSTEVAQTASSQLQIAENQGTYVRPEEAINRSQNVTLPGWVAFTIPANTTTITTGFEFHNPDKNLWYEDTVSINGTALENLVVDSGNVVTLDHYLGLAGINETVTAVTAYDENAFQISRDENGSYTLEAIGYYDGSKAITVTTDAGNTVTLDVTCAQDIYYMTFGLYLAENDELLYQSDLVTPGNYIQSMEMTRALEPGSYDAYVLCQPYRSDGVTETNSGQVKITLTAQ